MEVYDLFETIEVVLDKFVGVTCVTPKTRTILLGLFILEERLFNHGLTQSNYKELNVLYERYRDRGFEILAFPCNQFGYQKPGTNEEIEETVCTRFKAEFPIFDKIEVYGKNTAPPFTSSFLVNKEGKVVERYAPATSPLAVEKDIQNILP
ncbi:probable glutathione peroxidase 2 [Salvia splendens]|uniref:probable glutathione peroxidase 2 n=1 Tax=Salvia splendens TaxID=180675 RepID=UPI001C25A905|nr:probable glutathione peroxidase 2 [Salvia splendens]